MQFKGQFHSEPVLWVLSRADPVQGQSVFPYLFLDPAVPVWGKGSGEKRSPTPVPGNTRKEAQVAGPPADALDVTPGSQWD